MIATALATGFRILCLLLLVCVSVHGQQSGKRGHPFVYNPALHARASNGAIAVGINRATGQFWVETRSGVPILFNGKGGITSFANVRVGSTTFTNNDLHGAQAPLFTERMPFGSTSELPDRLVFTTRLHTMEGDAEVTQEFLPSIDNDYAFIRVTTTIKNTSSRSLPIGLLLLYDLMIAGDDNPAVTVDGSAVGVERDWKGGAVPVSWDAQSAASALHVRARLSGSGTDAPSQFCIGRWAYNGYLGAAAWNYVPSGLAMWDNAALLQWDQRSIGPGGEFRVVSDYGYLAKPEASLSCSADQVRVNAAQNGYDPDPFRVKATVRNTGSIDLSTIGVLLGLPAGVLLDAGETLAKTIGGPLAPGDSATVAWRLRATPSTTARIFNFGIDLTDPQPLRQSCVTSISVPALPTFDISIRCPFDTLRVALTPDGSDYVTDTFVSVLTADNAGTGMLTNISARFILPAGIALVSGSAALAMSPATLAPLQSAVASWNWRVEKQTSDRTFLLQWIVTCDQGVSDTCTAFVFAPALKPVPSVCVQNGVTTRGTDFWLAIPFNGGSDTKVPRVYIAAVDSSTIRVERPESGRTDQFVVPAGAVRQLDIEQSVELQVPETVQRKSIHITSDKPVSVYSASLMLRHSDASIVLPTAALGRRHVTAGYNFQTPDEHFIVVATEAETDVTIVPYALTSTQRNGGVPFTIRLGKGETYAVRSGITGAFGGLTGSTVDASKPVAVFSGARTGWIPENTLDDYGFLNLHYDQVLPEELLGTEYAAVPYLERRRGDTYKVIAAADSTDVTIGSNTPLRLDLRGAHREFVLGEASVVTATKPVLLAQFANSSMWDDSLSGYGDASMVVLPPVSRSASCHLFPSNILPLQSQGSMNQALQLDPGQWIDCPDTPLLAAPVFTAECWFRTTAHVVLASRRRRPGGTNDWALLANGQRQSIEFLTAAGGTADDSFETPTGLLRYGQWNHVACAVNGPAGTLRIYVNGVLALDTVFSPRQFDVVSGLAWGGYFGNANAAIGNVEFDECRYWTLARSQAQVMTARDARLGAGDRQGLAGYWSFCEDLTDESPAQNRMQAHTGGTLELAVDLPDAFDCFPAATEEDFANLVVQDGAQGSVRIDGVALPDTAFHRIGASRFFFARQRLRGDAHRIESSDPLGVGVTLYGFDYHDAYSMTSAFLTGAPHAVTSGAAPRIPDALQLSVDPNPVRSAAEVRYTLPAAADVDMALYDAAGRRLRTLAGGLTGPGAHRLTVETSGLGSGSYLLLLRAGGRQRAIPVTVVR